MNAEVSFRLLLLEDDPRDAELTIARIRRGGMQPEITHVTNREAFTQVLTSCEFDMILADYELPGFDGLSALAMAREHCPQIPFLFLSGMLGEELAVETLRRGATDYVLKHRADRLVPAIQRALTEADLRRDREQAAEALQQKTRELERKTEELTRSNHDLQQVAYLASHDLREPLRSIASFTQLLTKRYRGRLDPDADDYTQQIVTSVRRMDAVIDDLLAYLATVESRRTPHRPVAMTTMAQEAVERLLPLIEEVGGVVEIDALPEISGNERQLGHLMEQLIRNGLQFRGDAPPRIRVSAEREGEGWNFSVTDNGIGIEEKYFQEIFGLFRRLVGREVPGTGMGLAICQRIVELHQGRIWVESEPGHGSRFRFWLPG